MNHMTLVAVLAAGTASLSLGLAGCGSDDSSSAPSAPATSASSAPSAPTVRSSTALALTTDPAGALRFDETMLSSPPGSIEITLSNASSVPHNVAVGGQGESRTVSGGDTATLQIADLPAGAYSYYCTVGGHREAGMEGTLTVE